MPKKVLLVLLLLSVLKCAKITGDLLVITYQPLIFNLTFTSGIPLPQFQLLFNQIPIDYSVSASENSTSSFFIIQAITDGIVDPTTFITQKYVLMFTEPLTIANGNLNLDSFLLRAHRTQSESQYIVQPISLVNSHFKLQTPLQEFRILGGVMVSFVFIFGITTVIGNNAHNFISIYAYICLTSPLYTSLDYYLSFYLLFQPNYIQDGAYRLLYMCTPMLLVLGTFTLGIISRLTLNKLALHSAIWNYIYYYFSYKLFLQTYTMMTVSIVCNMMIYLTGKTTLTGIPEWVIGFYIYFSAATLAFYYYFCFFTVNPKIGQSMEQWLSYTNSQHYQHFQGLHIKLDANNWRKRNARFGFNTIRLVLLIMISFNMVGIPNLIVQVALLIYLFTSRPFRSNFFNLFSIGIQGIVVVFYLFRYIVRLYISISEEITTSNDISRILMANVIFLSIILLMYYVMGTYEFCQRVKSFKINYAVWEREVKYLRNQEEILRRKHKAFESVSREKPRKDGEKSKSVSNGANGANNQNRKLSMPVKSKTAQKLDVTLPKDQNKLKSSKNLKSTANFGLNQNYQKNQKKSEFLKQKKNSKLKNKSSLLQSMCMQQMQK